MDMLPIPLLNNYYNAKAYEVKGMSVMKNLVSRTEF